MGHRRKEIIVSKMLSSSFVWSLYLTFFILLIGHRPAIGQQDSLFYFCLGNRGNYTANSTYKENLDHLLSTLTSGPQIDYGFYNLSYGQDDSATAIGMCRGDAIPDICRRCLNNSVSVLPGRCPNQKEAILWYDNCMLRYSNRSLFGFMEDMPSFYMWNVENASDQVQYTQAAENLLSKLKDEAAAGDSRQKFATGNSTLANLPIIHGLVQCTPDLSRRDCDNCLFGAIGSIRNPQCNGKKGCRIVRPSCNVRFEGYLFFDYPPAPPSPPTDDTVATNTGGQESSSSFPRVVIIVVPIVVALVILLAIGICILSRSRKRRIKSPEKYIAAAEDESMDVESLQFDFNTIRIATNEFSDANKLGEGGFGSVYKGILPNGRQIAVKRLSRVSSQGDMEFKNEVLLVAKLQHRNLVQLLGFCLKDNEKLLIYEFVQNSSLEKFIFDPVKRANFNWETRYKVIGGIARGLVYLHEDSRLRIIHRDLKASNILLDTEMNAKISDFGTARLFVPDQTQGDTSRIVGTYGYMAPEYVMRGQFSVKSDVFSFGVLILEIVSGQKNNRVISNGEIEDLINYAWRNWREGAVGNIIDPTVQSGSRTEMARCIHIGLLCVQENLSDRPTMATVLLMLNSYSVTLPRPSQPAFFMNTTTSNYSNRSLQWRDDSQITAASDHSKDMSAEKSLNEASISELYPR